MEALPEINGGRMVKTYCGVMLPRRRMNISTGCWTKTNQCTINAEAFRIRVIQKKYRLGYTQLVAVYGQAKRKKAKPLQALRKAISKDTKQDASTTFCDKQGHINKKLLSSRHFAVKATQK